MLQVLWGIWHCGHSAKIKEINLMDNFQVFPTPYLVKNRTNNLDSCTLQSRYDSPVPLGVLLSRDVYHTMHVLLVRFNVTNKNKKEASQSAHRRECSDPGL